MTSNHDYEIRCLLEPGARHNHNRRSRRKPRRKGHALTEFAIFVPVLVLFAFVPVELASMIFLRHTLHVAANEGARIATKKATKPEDKLAWARQASEQVLQDRNVEEWTVEFSADPETIDDGEYLTVTASAQFGPNAVLGLYYTNYEVTSSVTMLKE